MMTILLEYKKAPKDEREKIDTGLFECIYEGKSISLSKNSTGTGIKIIGKNCMPKRKKIPLYKPITL
jgi:hypothetical protein